MDNGEGMADDIDPVKLEKFNTFMFIGAGLYSLWYIGNSIQVTKDEKLALKQLLEREMNIVGPSVVLNSLYKKVI